MNSKNITVTDARLETGFNTIISNVIDKKVPKQIQKAVNEVKIKTGVITKFYPYLDKAEVQLDLQDERRLCKILHRYGGDMIDFYTPLEHERGFDTTLNEPYIVPKAEQNVCVLNIQDRDSDEYLILGYYQNSEVVTYNPAKAGNIKLMSMGEDNLYWIKFGRDGFEYRLPSTPSMKVGSLDDEMEEVNYTHSANVYTKDEVYTKEEVDRLIREAIDEISRE